LQRQEHWLNSKDLDGVPREVSDLQSVSKALVLGIDVADLGEQKFPRVQMGIEEVDVPLNFVVSTVSH
jgi:hypothetical protein